MTQPQHRSDTDVQDSITALESNIQTLVRLRRDQEQQKPAQERIADGITRFAGSMKFVYLHIIWFGAWVLLNVGLLGREPFDPFPFGLLTMIVSLEAIYLSTFVLISQNRMTEAAEERAELDLHVNLLAEHEITRILVIVDAMADFLGLPEGQDSAVDELKQEIDPETVLSKINQRKQDLGLADEGAAPAADEQGATG